METLRQILKEKLGEKALLTKGFHIHAALAKPIQALAGKHLQAGLKALDKRQGWRGPVKHLATEEEIEVFFQKRGKKNG